MSEEEKEVEAKVESEFQQIRHDASNADSREWITERMVQKAVKLLKRNKACDRQGWTAEWLIYGGDEMIKSLTNIFNRIEVDREIPHQ